MTNPKPSHTRWKLTLAIVVLFAVPVGWFVAWPAYQQHRAIESMERLGGSVSTIGKGVWPIWCQNWHIGLHVSQWVELDGTRISDAELLHLRSLKKLERLNLNATSVSDDGVKHLKGMTNLRQLQLYDTNVTDAGLIHLSGMVNLELLILDGRKVTLSAVTTLQQALPSCMIVRQTPNGPLLGE